MKQHQSNMNLNKGKVKPIPPKKPQASVSNLRSRFESFNNGNTERNLTKTEPKPKIVLIRNESTRSEATLEFRKALVVNIPTTTKERPTTSTSVSDDSRCSDDVFENIYENLRVENPIEDLNANFEDSPSSRYLRPETSIYEDIDIDSSAVTSSGYISNPRLVNQSTLHQVPTSSNFFKPLTSPKPSRPTSPPPRPAEKTNSALLKDLMNEIEILNMKKGYAVGQPTVVDGVTIQRVSIRRDFDERLSIDSFESFDGSMPDEPNDEKFKNTQLIIQELLENERTYLLALKQGIDSYVATFDSVELPASLNGQKRNIFSNIEAIYKYHNETFYPKLVACGFDAQKIAEVFTTSIDEFQFDIYIVYVLKRKKSESLCTENDYFFKQIQQDRLGVRSFLLQPVQRLPRYRLLIGEILKSIMKNLDQNKEAVIACCIAEKKIERLLELVNEHC